MSLGSRPATVTGRHLISVGLIGLNCKVIYLVAVWVGERVVVRATITIGESLQTCFGKGKPTPDIYKSASHHIWSNVPESLPGHKEDAKLVSSPTRDIFISQELIICGPVLKVRTLRVSNPSPSLSGCLTLNK